jgi:hypothetical protein
MIILQHIIHIIHLIHLIHYKQLAFRVGRFLIKAQLMDSKFYEKRQFFRSKIENRQNM